jgi:hypothetical protein
MSISRAPRGTSTGGQFVATPHSEPSLSLRPEGAGPSPVSEQEPVRPRVLGFTDRGRQIRDFRDGTDLDYEDLTEPEKAEVRQIAKDQGFRNPKRNAFQKMGDEIGETVDALSEVASHVADVQRGNVPAPKVEGTFAEWNTLLPKFMRRKS